MKKVICFLMTIIMAISMFGVPALADGELGVILDGEPIEFDVQPQIINGRTMVPMRKIFETLGASVEWDGNARKITATRQDKTVVMYIDNTIFSVNGKPITLDVPPQIVEGRTLVPVRAIAESFDIYVIWDDIYNTVVLSHYLPFESSIQAFDYLCAWLLENGKAFAEYVYIGVELADGIEIQVRSVPNAVEGRSCIILNLNSIGFDDCLTNIFLWPTYDGTSVSASYIHTTATSQIEGDIDMTMHTDNYPLQCRESELGEGDNTWDLLEDTRQRINLLLDEADMLLSFAKTGVNLRELGFKKR